MTTVPLLTVLPLNYFMLHSVPAEDTPGVPQLNSWLGHE
jgi:hypothetical protein